MKCLSRNDLMGIAETHCCWVLEKAYTDANDDLTELGL